MLRYHVRRLEQRTLVALLSTLTKGSSQNVQRRIFVNCAGVRFIIYSICVMEIPFLVAFILNLISFTSV